jgi:hypothetical protein
MILDLRITGAERRKQPSSSGKMGNYPNPFNGFTIVIFHFIIFLGLCVSPVKAGEYPKTLHAYRGTTPVLDGVLSPGEWEDAEDFFHDPSWNSDFQPVKDGSDLSLHGWVKNDGVNLYFAFDVTDDVIYGVDIERWLPVENPKAHELSREGWPWFGDGIEIFCNPENIWNNSTRKETEGDGTSWKMVCSTHKSRLGGVGAGGLLEGEPRSSETAWNNYQQWILTGAMQAAVRIKNKPVEGSGYVAEWMVKPDPCLILKNGSFWNGAMGSVPMGLNVEVQDLDTKEAGAGSWANFHHVDYWAAETGKKELLARWGTLVVEPSAKPLNGVIKNSFSSPVDFELFQNAPNPFNPFTRISFTLQTARLIRLFVYDMTGRKIRTLADGGLQRGQHHLQWDGLDDTRQAAPSGVYFYRLETKEGQLVKKMILMR